MKTTIVPAQITTVEDKIAGPLGLTQLLLLMAPIFIGAAIYAILPPTLVLSLYKIVLVGILAAVCSLMAIRVKGKILLLWVVVILQYNIRPRYYVFDKNDTYMRPDNAGAAMGGEIADETAPVNAASFRRPAISLSDRVKVEALMDNPDTDMSFIAGKKGDMRVVVSK